MILWRTTNDMGQQVNKATIQYDNLPLTLLPKYMIRLLTFVINLTY